jgi:transposase, IS30 family
MKAVGLKTPAIARKIGRDPTTIRRELRRSRPFFLGYFPSKAEEDAREKRSIPRRSRKLDNERLWRLVKQKLSLRWSPEQIAHFLKATYPLDTAMQVSHESIYFRAFLKSP